MPQYLYAGIIHGKPVFIISASDMYKAITKLKKFKRVQKIEQVKKIGKTIKSEKKGKMISL